MRLLIVNTLYRPYRVGGAEISVEALAKEFRVLGMDVAILTLGEEDCLDTIENIPVWRLKIENSFWPYNNEKNGSLKKIIWHLRDIYNKGYDKKILNVFDEFNPDIVFTNNLSGFSVRIWDLAQSRRLKTVHTIRDYYLQCPKTNKFRGGYNCVQPCIDCKLLSYTKKHVSKNVDHLVGISDYILQDHLNEGYFKDVKNNVIYNGFDFTVNTQDFTLLNENEIVFGFIGQIKKEKGVELMLESFKKVNNNKWKLLIAGNLDKKYLENLNAINNSNNISYLGYINSQEFYKKIDVLIVPSLWNEPFGRVVLEGIINNKIVITSKQGGIKELMRQNMGNTFELNTDELSKKIDTIIENRKELSFQTGKEFMDQFKIKNTALKYFKIFSNL